MQSEWPKSLVDDDSAEGREASAALLAIVENQLRDATPTAVPETLARLMALGHTRALALHLIACAFSVELFEILERKSAYDEARYLRNLAALPALPYDEDEI